MSSTVFGLFLNGHVLRITSCHHDTANTDVVTCTCSSNIALIRNKCLDMSCSQAQRDHTHAQLQRNNTHDVCDTMSPDRKKHATHHTNGMSSHDVPRQEKGPRLLDVTGQRTAGHVPSHLLRCKTNPENKYGPTTSTNRTIQRTFAKDVVRQLSYLPRTIVST